MKEMSGTDPSQQEETLPEKESLLKENELVIILTVLGLDCGVIVGEPNGYVDCSSIMTDQPIYICFNGIDHFALFLPAEMDTP